MFDDNNNSSKSCTFTVSMYDTADLSGAAVTTATSTTAGSFKVFADDSAPRTPGGDPQRHPSPSSSAATAPFLAAASDASCAYGQGVGSLLSGGGEGEGRWIWVLDPLTRKLRVPTHLLVPTQATATAGTVPSLCIAFLEGRCRHPWCRQAHVLPSAIPQLRYEALHAPTCCRHHQDPHDTADLTRYFTHIRVLQGQNTQQQQQQQQATAGDSASDDAQQQQQQGGGVLIPTDRVASTVGLRRYLVQHGKKDKEEEAGEGAQSVLVIPGKYVCRLHLAHRCRYLEDCNNIHVCREYEAVLQQPTQPSSALLTAAHHPMHVPSPNGGLQQLPPSSAAAALHGRPFTVQQQQQQQLAALQALTQHTRTVTLGETTYSVTAVAPGEVSDEEFERLYDAQLLQLSLDGGAKTPGSVTATPGGFRVTSGGALPAFGSSDFATTPFKLPGSMGASVTGAGVDGPSGGGAPPLRVRVIDVRDAPLQPPALAPFSAAPLATPVARPAPANVGSPAVSFSRPPPLGAAILGAANTNLSNPHGVAADLSSGNDSAASSGGKAGATATPTHNAVSSSSSASSGATASYKVGDPRHAAGATAATTIRATAPQANHVNNKRERIMMVS